MKKIMIVDNEKDSQEELCKILSQNGIYDICTKYTNAISAMEALDKEKPDIVLADILIPGISGIELAKQIRSLYPMIQVILMSKSLNLAVKVYDVGAAGFILKPLRVSKVLDAVKRLL